MAKVSSGAVFGVVAAAVVVATTIGIALVSGKKKATLTVEYQSSGTVGLHVTWSGFPPNAQVFFAWGVTGGGNLGSAYVYSDVNGDGDVVFSGMIPPGSNYSIIGVDNVTGAVNAVAYFNVP
jgi:hypothetical protein